MQSRFQLISPARSPSVGSHSIRSTSCSGNLAVCRVGVPVGHCSVGLQACASKPGPFPTICLASRIVGYSCHLPALASWPDIVGRSGMADAFRDVRDALAARQGSPGSGWVVEHNDVTCDGCEAEPIIGSRFRCTVCPDRDLCERCMRGMMAARLEISRGGEGSWLRRQQPGGAPKPASRLAPYPIRHRGCRRRAHLTSGLRSALLGPLPPLRAHHRRPRAQCVA